MSRKARQTLRNTHARTRLQNKGAQRGPRVSDPSSVGSSNNAACLSVPSRFVPTRWAFTGRCHRCRICARCLSRRGEYVGYIQKSLEKGYLEHPGSACCTDDMFEIFVHAQWHKYTRTTMATLRIRNNQRSPVHCSVPCIVEFPTVCSKMYTYPPVTHTFLKRPFLTDFKKCTHIPPYGTNFWRIGPKVQRPKEKCEPRRHKPNVPERCSTPMGAFLLDAVRNTRAHTHTHVHRAKQSPGPDPWDTPGHRRGHRVRHPQPRSCPARPRASAIPPVRPTPCTHVCTRCPSGTHLQDTRATGEGGGGLQEQLHTHTHTHTHMLGTARQERSKKSG